MIKMLANIQVQISEEDISLFVPLPDEEMVVIPIPMEEFSNWKHVVWNGNAAMALTEAMGLLARMNITPEQYKEWRDTIGDMFQENELSPETQEHIQNTYLEVMASLKENFLAWKKERNKEKRTAKKGMAVPVQTSGLQA